MLDTSSSTRPLRYFVTISLFFILFISSAGADSLLETNRETAPYHEIDNWSGNFAFINDVLGFDHDSEWDDGRTGGLEFFVRAPIPIYSEFGYSVFTYRSNPTEMAESRVDAIHFVTGAIFEGDFLGGQYRAMLGLGGLFFGNYSGYDMQAGIHEVMGQKRPIPMLNQYDSSVATFLISGESGLNGPMGWPIGVSLFYAFGGLGYVELEPEVSLLLDSPFGSARLGLAYRYTNSGSLPDTVAHRFDAANGLWVEMEFAAHTLVVKHTLEPGDNLTQGSIGLRFGALRANPRAKWNGDYRVEISPILGATAFLNHVAWSPADWRLGDSRFSLTMDLHSSAAGDDANPKRFQKTLVGTEWSLPIRLGRKMTFEPYGGLSLGFVNWKEYQPLTTVYTAETTANYWYAIGRISAGFRFTPVAVIRSQRYLGFGVVFGISADIEMHNLGTGSYSVYGGLSFNDASIF